MLSRADDLINCAGHRLGTSLLEQGKTCSESMGAVTDEAALTLSPVQSSRLTLLSPSAASLDCPMSSRVSPCRRFSCDNMG